MVTNPIILHRIDSETGFVTLFFKEEGGPIITGWTLEHAKEKFLEATFLAISVRTFTLISKKEILSKETFDIIKENILLYDIYKKVIEEFVIV